MRCRRTMFPASIWIKSNRRDVLTRRLADPVLFSQVIGEFITRAAEASLSGDRGVVAFGEMVALLWAEGHAEACD